MWHLAQHLGPQLATAAEAYLRAVWLLADGTAIPALAALLLAIGAGGCRPREAND